jgi:peptidyl-prolyl cis-trans isomerase B (cyclophilin B)
MKRFLPALVVFAVLAGCSEPEPKPNPEESKDEVGTVKIELFADKAPITVKNFLTYVDEKHYDGTIFHRVMPDFMIQGGHFQKGFAKARTYEEAEKLGKPTHGNIKNEAKNGPSNTRGTLAMARQNAPHTASDQFFINVVDNSKKLDPGKLTPDGYAVFGKVIDGMDVIDKIKKVETLEQSRAGHEAVPVEDVIIESVRREPTEEGKNPVVVMKVRIPK